MYAQNIDLEFVRPRHANVLIIDDDIDAAILVDSMLRRFGCNTSCTLDFADAAKRICAHKADVIILDWMLGDKTMADEVLRQSIKTIEKFGPLQEEFYTHRPKIISYSSLAAGELQIPKSEYFEHFDHWQKPMTRSELIRRANQLLHAVHF